MCAFAGAFIAAIGAIASWEGEHPLHPGHHVAARAVLQPAPSPSFSPLPQPSPAAVSALAAPHATAPPAAPAPVSRPAPPPPPARVVIGSYQQQLINQDRAAYGLPPLTWSSCLANVAAENAARMAAQGAMSHANGISADLNCGLGGTAGENLGYWTGGVDDTQLNTMFMNSAEHRSNILGDYRYVGTAWVTAPNGTAYLAVEFES